jgi:hypothetical protein
MCARTVANTAGLADAAIHFVRACGFAGSIPRGAANHLGERRLGLAGCTGAGAGPVDVAAAACRKTKPAPLAAMVSYALGARPGPGGCPKAMPRSRSQTIRSFRSATGLTPGAYLRQLRVQKSRRLLGPGGLSLAELAAQLGFADQSHFTREFRRVFGITPGRFGSVVVRAPRGTPLRSEPQ